LSDNEAYFLACVPFFAARRCRAKVREADSSNVGRCLSRRGALYGAGSDTTADGINTFIMAMITHPEVQAKAQAELDSVVGRGRLPSFADQPDLIYCGAVVREILRWRTVIAGGLAHATTEDDWYNGASALFDLPKSPSSLLGCLC